MSRRSHSRESRQKPASTTLGITSLGIDVLINLIKYLRPCDILSLRKTSRFFHSVTKHRTVWLNALRGVMHKHFITKATYPLESMSLPLLEHAALSPYKFASLVERSPSSGIKPTSIRILSPLLTKAEKDRYGIIGFGAVDDIIFCPGGRYLATVSLFDGEATKALITVWDLGISGYDRIKALARTVQLSSSSTEVLYLLPTSGGNDLCLITLQQLSTVSSLNLNFRFSAHNITISSRIPEFVEVAHIDLPSYSSLKSFHLASERLIFTALVEDSGGPSSVLVWDFMNQSAVLWNLPASVIDTDAIIASSNEDSIIVAALGQFWIFNVPPLISYTIATITSTPHEPSLALVNPLALPFSDPYEPYCIAQTTSYSDLPRYFCDVNGEKFILKEIRSTGVAGDPLIPRNVPVVVGTWDYVDSTILTFRTELQYCGDTLCMASSNDEVVCRLVADPKGEVVGDFSEVKVATLSRSHRGIAIYNHEFSAVAGRVCLLLKDKEVHILDYLEPPEPEDRLTDNHTSI